MRWKLLEGDRQVEFSEPDKLQSWASFDRPGTYTLQATATGGDRMGVAHLVVTILGPATHSFGLR